MSSDKIRKPSASTMLKKLSVGAKLLKSKSGSYSPNDKLGRFWHEFSNIASRWDRNAAFKQVISQNEMASWFSWLRARRKPGILCCPVVGKKLFLSMLSPIFQLRNFYFPEHHPNDALHIQKHSVMLLDALFDECTSTSSLFTAIWRPLAKICWRPRYCILTQWESMYYRMLRKIAKTYFCWSK